MPCLALTVSYVTMRATNGAAIRAIRETLGVPQGKLAERVGVSHGFLCNVEAGKKRPSPAIARRIADELGVPLDAITYPVREHATTGAGEVA